MQRTLLRLCMGLALASLLLTTACAGGSPVASREEATPTAIPTPIVASKPTYQVKRGDIVTQLSFSGRIVPTIEETLFFRTDGRVRTVYVKPGDQVTRGQVLADLLSLDELEKTQRQDELSLRRAEIQLEMAKLRQQLSATTTPSYALNYETEMAMKAYEVELAEIALEEQKLKSSKVQSAIKDAQIIAPIDGQVLSIALREGDSVSAYKAVAVVGDVTQLEVGAKLLSQDLELLTEGMPVSVKFSNKPDEPVTGTIRHLPYPYGSTSEKPQNEAASPLIKTSDTNTRIALEMPEGSKLRMGDMVEVTVVLQEKKGILWLPPAAVRTFEGRNFVVVQTDDSTQRRVDIKTGLRNEDMIEVEEGLEEGQTVVAP